jgi:hypothetical protein
MTRAALRSVAVAVVSLLLGAAAAAPAIAVNATATLVPALGLSFGNVRVGATSAGKNATLSNSGPVSISVSISASGDFEVSGTTCASTLDGGSSCTISVVFKPTSSGSKAGTLTVSTDASNGDQSIPLSGTGTLPGAKLSSTSLSFGNWAVGVASTPKTVKLSNTGTATLKISSISVSGDYKQTNGCGATLAAGASCTITVTFTAKALGSRTGTLTVKDDAGSGTQTASLSGTGVKLTITLDPATLDFKIQRIHTVSIPRSLTLTNKGAVSLLVSAISTNKPYSQTNTCGGTVPAGGSCTISVSFAPETEGASNGTVTIKDSGGSQKVALSGIGGFPAFSADLKRLVFDKLEIGSDSLPEDLKITNEGTDKLFINRISISGDFSQTNTCEPYVNPGITCAISVTFTPGALGDRKGILKIDQELGIYKVSLTGTGLPAGASPRPTSSSVAPGAVPLGPGDSSGGRGLSARLVLIAILGLLLFLAGGAFLWRPLIWGRQETLPSRSLAELFEEPGGTEQEEPSAAKGKDEDVLEWFLSDLRSGEGGEELDAAPGPRSSPREAAEPVSQTRPMARSRVAEAPVAAPPEPDKEPFDWQTDPDSPLA